jgi:translation elongation factor EF-1alpha
MEVKSLQIEHESVESAKKGDSIGVQVTDKSRRKDKVYKLVD